jgi:hypothetical protein
MKEDKVCGDVANIGENMLTVLLGKPEGKRPLEDLGIDGWLTLKN